MSKCKFLRKKESVLGNGFKLLLLLFVFLFRTLLRGIEPFDGFSHRIFQLLLVSSFEFISEFLVGDGVTQVISVRFNTILGGDARSRSLILS